MAYQVVEDDLHTCPTCGPFGITLGLRYDPVTGEYQLKEEGLLGYDTPLTAIFYQDGTWAMDAIQDPQLFVDGDPQQPTPLAQSLSTLLRQKTQQAHVAIGGNAGGNNLHPTAQISQHTAVPGVLNQFPGTNPGIATAIPGGNILATPPGTSTDPTQTPAATAAASKAAESKSTSSGFTSLLKYPLDVLEIQQDFLKVEQFKLSPAGDVFGNPGNTLTSGLKALGGRTKESQGRLYLPIPNNAADSNATAWGADQMNNLTASIVAMASKDIKSNLIANPSSITAAISAAMESITGVNPSQAVAIGRVVADAGGMDALQDPRLKQQIQTAITSSLLKQAGFDVPPEQILARSGVVPNSNLELLFNNVTLREFTFSYRMSPRSEPEAEMVRKIIRFFKKGMAAKKTTSAGSTNAGSLLGAPNIFELTYMTGDSKNISGMNKFKPCALTNFAVNYSPDGQFSAYDEGQPVSYNIGMSFSEIVPLYESDYDDSSNIGY